MVALSEDEEDVDMGDAVEVEEGEEAMRLSTAKGITSP